MLLAVDRVQLAKSEYEKHIGYKICIALCNNIFAMCCIDLKQFEQADEHLKLNHTSIAETLIEKDLYICDELQNINIVLAAL